MSTEQQTQPYPVNFEVDHAEKQSRWKVFFRLILIIPIVLWFSSFHFAHFINDCISYLNLAYVIKHITGLNYVQTIHFMHVHKFAPRIVRYEAFVLFPVLWMILFRKKYPQWLFDFNTGFYAFMQRFIAYFFFLTDEYPNTDKESSVRVQIDYPEKGVLLRFMPFVKWLLAFPHYICLFGLNLCFIALTIVAWFIVLFIGRYPQAMHNLNVSIVRWNIRVACYMALLTTDKYPPFSLH